MAAAGAWGFREGQKQGCPLPQPSPRDLAHTVLTPAPQLPFCGDEKAVCSTGSRDHRPHPDPRQAPIPVRPPQILTKVPVSSYEESKNTNQLPWGEENRGSESLSKGLSLGARSQDATPLLVGEEWRAVRHGLVGGGGGLRDGQGSGAGWPCPQHPSGHYSTPSPQLQASGSGPGDTPHLCPALPAFLALGRLQQLPLFHLPSGLFPPCSGLGQSTTPGPSQPLLREALLILLPTLNSAP